MKTKSRSLLMKRICSLVLVMAMVFTSISMPVNAEEGGFELSDDSRIVVVLNDLTNENKALEDDMKLMSSEFAAKGLTNSGMDIVYGTESTAKTGDILVCLTEGTADSNPEGYELEIGDVAKVTATDEDGIFYGMRRIQKAMIANDGELTHETITEEPAVSVRAYHLDNARKYFTKDWILALIKDLSYLNINELQYHFSENEGFRLQSDTVEARVPGFTYPSDGYMTKQDMLDIIAECNKYHIELIPSMDSPGHMRYILQYLPANWNVNHLFPGDFRAVQTFNIFENADAKALIMDMFEEYAEFFSEAGCKHMNIGGDEFLNNFGSMTNDQHKMVMDYFNEVAALVKSYGLTPRAWNDGLRYQGFTGYTLDPDIEICYWSAPNNCATVADFVNNGHKVINYRDNYMYYVLASWWMSYANPAADRIYNEWTPGTMPGLTGGVSQDYEYPYDDSLLGASFAVWCDTPNYLTQDQVASNTFMRTRAMAARSWNPNLELTYAELETLANKIGRAPGYDSALPEAGTVYYAGELGTVTIHYVDEAGNGIKADKNLYGIVGEEYVVEETPIYGYRFVSMEGAGTGTFTEEDIVVTLTYELYTDKSELQAKVNAEKLEQDYIPKTFVAYKTAIAEAKEVLTDDTATQLRVDEVLAALETAEEELVLMNRLELYLEVTNPKSGAGYTTDTYADYTDAVEAGEVLLHNAEASDTEVAAALQAILAAKTGLVAESNSGISVSANKDTYLTYSLSNILDGNPNTYAWLDGAQTTGDYLMFTFASPVILNTFNLQYPTAAGGDYFQHADVEISANGEDWTKIGEAGNSASAGITANANGAVTQYVRVRVTQTITNWTQISEATFDYEEIAPVDTTELQSEVEEVMVMDLTPYTTESVSDLVDALEDAYAVLNGSTATEQEVADALAAVQDARTYLIEKEVDPDAPVDKKALAAAIATAQTFVEEEYTKESWEPFASALASAIAVNEDADATATEVSEALSALRAAQRELKIMVHKTVLAAAIAAAENLEEDDYTPSSWSAFSAALNTAREVNANEDATQAAVDKAVADLTAAQGALVEKADDPTDASKDLETSKITYSTGSEVEPGNASSTEGGIRLAFDNNTNTYWHSAWEPTWYGTDDCEEHLWVKFDLSEATVVDAIRYLPRPANSRNGDITSYRVEGTVDGSTWTTLTEGTWESTSQEWKIAKFTAVELQGLRLVITGTFGDTATNKFASAAELRVRTATLSETPDPSTVDKTELAAAIAEAEELTAEDYTANSWETLQIALVEAKAVNANVNATQEAVDSALANLTAAKDALEDKPVVTPVDKSALATAIAEAEELTAEDYTADSWATFAAALEAAQTVENDDNATQEAVDEALADLTAAQDALENKPVDPQPPVDPVNPFEDVYDTDYYYDPVMWAVEEGITDGWTETLYAPGMGCTRGQVVTFLWRAAGEPEAENAENPFADVAEGAYYYDAVLWAVEEGITDGWTEDTFAPDMTCTRGQIVTFIWRAAGKPMAANAENPFADVAENAYYYDAILWAVENQITDGWTATEFAPEMECTRGQVVTFLYRHYN